MCMPMVDRNGRVDSGSTVSMYMLVSLAAELDQTSDRYETNVNKEQCLRSESTVRVKASTQY
jgi:hypothetical protein